MHRRIAAGETLNATDQAAYDTGCRELDAEEVLDGDIQRLRDLRAHIAAAESRQQLLREREHDLDARIASLEARLDSRTRQLLGIGS